MTLRLPTSRQTLPLTPNILNAVFKRHSENLTLQNSALSCVISQAPRSTGLWVDSWTGPDGAGKAPVDLAASHLPLNPHPSEHGGCPQEPINIPGNEMQLQPFSSSDSSLFADLVHLFCRSKFAVKNTAPLGLNSALLQV